MFWKAQTYYEKIVIIMFLYSLKSQYHYFYKLLIMIVNFKFTIKTSLNVDRQNLYKYFASSTK